MHQPLLDRALNIRLNPAQIRQNARVIHHMTRACHPEFESGNFRRFSNSSLAFVFRAIDNVVFDQLVQTTADRMHSPIRFRVSQRMTRSGGITTMTVDPRTKERRFEIALSAPLILHSFSDDDPKAILVTGIPCRDRLEALQRIMEHEMIHLIEMLIWDDSSCSQARFQGIARRLFGHTQPTHQLLTPRELARRDHGIQAGQWVVFRYQNRQLRGRVNRITKRATVLVPSPKGQQYTDGKTYEKFYVPVSMLRPDRS